MNLTDEDLAAVELARIFLRESPFGSEDIDLRNPSHVVRGPDAWHVWFVDLQAYRSHRIPMHVIVEVDAATGEARWGPPLE
jgi:hypothetical protein